MILKTHDLETLYSSYKIYIKDKININFSHFIILQFDSILVTTPDYVLRSWCQQPDASNGECRVMVARPGSRLL